MSDPAADLHEAWHARLHQVFIGDEPSVVESVRFDGTRRYGAVFADYRCWSAEEARALLGEDFGPEAVAAFDALRPYAYRADLARYAIVHRHGGWYADIGLRDFARPSLERPVALVAFRDRQAVTCTSWAAQNALFFSVPGNPVLATAVAEVLRNVRERYYGFTPVHPTGPALFGKAVAIHGDRQATTIGEVRESVVDGVLEHAFVLPDDRIVALAKREPGGVLPIAGTNNYNDFWHARTVYADPA